MLNTRSSSFHGRMRVLTATATGAALVVVAAGCSTASKKPAASPAGATGSATKISVAAAEDFWGSVAKQLGGDHVTETSVVSNPDTDPHAYEPTPADGAKVTTAQYVIADGLGYDTWVQKFLATNQASSNRKVLTVGDFLGLKDGDNPHQWYSHDSVYKVIDQITADYKKIDPADAAYFDAQKQNFETQTLAKYNQLEADIKAKYAGTPIGASESIVSPLADSLGLKMLTPYSFLTAISEGADVSAADKSTIDQQISAHAIKVYVFNSQNSTPDIAAQVSAAKAAGIPVSTVTETLAPAGTPFQDWQTTQLQNLENALAQATGK